MSLIDEIAARQPDPDRPSIIAPGATLSFSDIRQSSAGVSAIEAGDVVAIIGDFDAPSISALLNGVKKKPSSFH